MWQRSFIVDSVKIVRCSSRSSLKTISGKFVFISYYNITFSNLIKPINIDTNKLLIITYSYYTCLTFRENNKYETQNEFIQVVFTLRYVATQFKKSYNDLSLQNKYQGNTILHLTRHRKWLSLIKLITLNSKLLSFKYTQKLVKL